MTQELHNYIKSQRDAGVDDLQIKKALLDAGWRIDLVEAGLAPPKKQAETIPAPIQPTVRSSMKTIQPSAAFIKEQQTDTPPDEPKVSSPSPIQPLTQPTQTKEPAATQTMATASDTLATGLAVAAPSTAGDVYPEPVKGVRAAQFVGGTNDEVTDNESANGADYTHNPLQTLRYSFVYYFQNFASLLVLSLLAGAFVSGAIYLAGVLFDNTSRTDSGTLEFIVGTGVFMAIFSAVVAFIAPYVYKVVGGDKGSLGMVFKPQAGAWVRVFTATFLVTIVFYIFYWLLFSVLLGDLSGGGLLFLVLALFSLETQDILILYGSFLLWFMLQVRFLGFMSFAMTEARSFTEGLRLTLFNTKNAFLATFGTTILYVWSYELFNYINSKFPADQNFLYQLQLDNTYLYITALIFIITITSMPLVIAYAYRYRAARAGSKNNDIIVTVINVVLLAAYLGFFGYDLYKVVETNNETKELYGFDDSYESDYSELESDDDFNSSYTLGYTETELRTDGGVISAALESYAANNGGVYPDFLTDLLPDYLDQNELRTNIYSFIYSPLSPDGRVCFDECRDYSLSVYTDDFELLEIK
ncbi:TPA: hypothetical protein EYO12_03935 [Candidatus Saccharibacteria bacterium]|nr:hypothetical protein [Candidatus Saccharibacteria bacterium]HIO87815.1 hypothetical protein [Candidatus Saccharibacteria bacterium]